MAIKLFSRGAAEEVTGSRHFLETSGGVIQIDCGAFQGRRRESEQKNRAIAGESTITDALVLTHAHFDHCGMIPLLVKNGYDGNIYSTSATRDLSSLVMLDSAHIQARDIEFLKKKSQRQGEQFKGEPLYNEEDALKAVSQFVTVSYNRPLPIGQAAELTLYDAGHILGSAIAYLKIRNNDGEPVSIAFTGDLGRNNKPIIRDPQPIPTPDYLVLESTYGDRLHQKTGEVMDTLASIVNKTVDRKGRILIPAFTIERTQELIYYLHLLVDRKKIPRIPIYIDSPMATNATSIFRVHPECYDKETGQAFLDHHKNPFGFDELHYTSSVAESKALNDARNPVIIISADGMCEAGRIRHHLIKAIEDERNTILIVGYMAAHTLGRRIRDRQKEVRIFGEYYNLKAEVAEINALSAHADYSEMGDYVTQLDLEKLKRVFLVHGESKSQNYLKQYLGTKGVRDVEIVKYGEEYFLNSVD
jgi:metallo-beta-lactamase family protein